MVPDIEITEEYVRELMYLCIKNFNESNAPQKYKKFINNLDIVVYINNRVKKFLGFAQYLPNTRSNIKKYKIKKDFKCIRFENKKQYACIEICPKGFKWYENKNEELYDTIAHELGHIMELKINGNENRNIIKQHTELWEKMAMYFGSTETKEYKL